MSHNRPEHPMGKADPTKPIKHRYIIHVNRQHIAKNAKDGGNRPVYTIKENISPSHIKIRYAREIEIDGFTRLVYDGTQLKCGARAWIETSGSLTLIDEMTFQEAKNSP